MSFYINYIFSDVGPNFGKRATWIGASGDQTFMMIDESLITGSMLSNVNVVADKQTICMKVYICFSIKSNITSLLFSAYS